MATADTPCVPPGRHGSSTSPQRGPSPAVPLPAASPSRQRQDRRSKQSSAISRLGRGQQPQCTCTTHTGHAQAAAHCPDFQYSVSQLQAHAATCYNTLHVEPRPASRGLLHPGIQADTLYHKQAATQKLSAGVDSVAVTPASTAAGDSALPDALGALPAKCQVCPAASNAVCLSGCPGGLLGLYCTSARPPGVSTSSTWHNTSTGVAGLLRGRGLQVLQGVSALLSLALSGRWPLLLLLHRALLLLLLSQTPKPH